VRSYPALELSWPATPAAGDVERALAEIDVDEPTGVEDRISGARVFFPSAALRDRAAIRLLGFDPTPTCTPIEVPDDDWAARSQASLGAVTIDQLVVAPPWAVPGNLEGRTLLIIQPSMGFGTGHHPSTRLVLRRLQQLAVRGKRVIDIGTGSAVLAIAAEKLGADRVVGLDTDPDALTAAAENLQLNECGRIELRQLDLASQLIGFQRLFDIVLANLTGALLYLHASTLSGLATADGVIVVSGFEEVDLRSVTEAFSVVGWAQEGCLREDDWIALALRSSPTRSIEH
jgi:ribosomal protein L11 methyltransferase